MAYLKLIRRRRSCALTEEEWQAMEAGWRLLPPRPGLALPYAAPRPVDWDVLCFWCRGYHLASEVKTCMSIPSKRSVTAKSGLSASAVQPGELFGKLPELWDFLTRRVDEDGKARQSPSISLKCEPSGFRLTLNDNHTGLYASLQGGGPVDLLEQAELRLAANEIDWRVSDRSQSRRK